MKPVIVINRLVIKPGKMDRFIEVQRTFAATLTGRGLIGGRMYRSVDGQTAVLVSTFESKSAHEETLQGAAFKDHVRSLQDFVESSTPAVYDEAYTSGEPT